MTRPPAAVALSIPVLHHTSSVCRAVAEAQLDIDGNEVTSVCARKNGLLVPAGRLTRVPGRPSSRHPDGTGTARNRPSDLSR